MENSLALIIGEVIRKIRLEKGLSQDDLANLSGTYSSYIGKIERGEKNLTVETLNNVIKPLGVTLEEFFSYFPSEDINNEKPNFASTINRIKQMHIEDRKKFINIVEELLDWKMK